MADKYNKNTLIARLNLSSHKKSIKLPSIQPQSDFKKYRKQHTEKQND